MSSQPKPIVRKPRLNTFWSRFNPGVFLEYGAVLIVLSILGVMLFGRTLWLPPGNMLYGQDSHSFGYFVFDYLVRSIKNGVMPWWNPYWFSGVPNLSNPATGTIFYPGNILFFLFPISKAFVLFFLLHIVGAGTAMYWFCRKYMDMLSSLVAAIVLSLSGYMIGAVYMGHTETVAVMAWLPLILGSLIRFLESKKRKYLLLFVLSLTFQILAGTYIAVLFTLELIILYFVYIVITDWLLKRSVRPILIFGGLIALGVILAFGLSAAELVPFLENTGRSIRSEGLPFDVAAKDSFNWNLWYILVKVIDMNVKIMVDPAKNIAAGSNINFEFLFFIGYAALGIILMGLVLEFYRLIRTKKADRIWIFSLVVLVVFTVLAFGRNTPVYEVLYHLVPLYQLIRRPIRHFFIIIFILAYLAGRGTYRLQNQLPKSLKFLTLLIPLLISIELLQFGKLFIRVIPEPYVLNSKGLITFLKEHIGNSRLHLNFRNAGITGVLLYEDAGSYYHFPMISGYSPMILDRYYRFVRTASMAQGAALAKIFPLTLNSPVINFLSVRYVIDQKLKPEDRDDKRIPEYFNPVYEDDAAVLYENPKAFPRYFLVDTIGAAKTYDEIATVLGSSKINLAKTVLLTDTEAKKLISDKQRLDSKGCPKDTPPGEVHVESSDIHSVRLTVQSQCPAVLMTSDPYYPGWEAKVDGQNTYVITADGAFRAVLVGTGKHTVEFSYNPKIYVYGICITLLSLLTILVVLKRFPGKVMIM